MSSKMRGITFLLSKIPPIEGRFSLPQTVLTLWWFNLRFIIQARDGVYDVLT